MTITCTDTSLFYQIPSGNEILKYACEVYGFLLNCSDHRNKTLNGREFAGLIKKHYDGQEPTTKAICDELEKQS